MATEHYLLSIQGAVQGVENTCGLYFRTNDAVANDTLNNGKDLIEAWQNDIRDLWLDCCPDSYQLNRLIARRVLPVGSAQAFSRYQTGEFPGDMTGQASALQNCPAVRLIPDTLGATAGRIFMPSPAISALNSNAYSAGYVTAVTNLFDTMQATIANVFNWTLAVHHAKTDTFSLCIGHNLSPRFGFQRRRTVPV